MALAVNSCCFVYLELLAKRSRLVYMKYGSLLKPFFKAIAFCCSFWIQERLYTRKMLLLVVEANFRNNIMQTWILKLIIPWPRVLLIFTDKNLLQVYFGQSGWFKCSYIPTFPVQEIPGIIILLELCAKLVVSLFTFRWSLPVDSCRV